LRYAPDVFIGQRGQVKPSHCSSSVAAFFSCVIAFSAYAQPAAPKAPAGIVRAVLASTALPSVTDAPRYYKLVRIVVPADKATTYSGPVGFVFLLSGSLQVTAGADRQILERGDGFAVAAGRKTTLTAVGSEPAVYLHFVLSRADELNQSMEGAPAVVTELYRNASPIPGLKPGPHEFSLARVTFSPRLPLNPPHRRSGAALYYVLAGPGIFATGGKSELKQAGVAHFEPYDLVHQWGNAADTPLVLIQANISQEGVPAVIFVPEGPASAK
jgi:quercetin dioxygenase-like cupin family protein